jgi:hypothetical protein
MFFCRYTGVSICFFHYNFLNLKIFCHEDSAHPFPFCIPIFFRISFCFKRSKEIPRVIFVSQKLWFKLTSECAYVRVRMINYKLRKISPCKCTVGQLKKVHFCFIAVVFEILIWLFVLRARTGIT